MENNKAEKADLNNFMIQVPESSEWIKFSGSAGTWPDSGADNIAYLGDLLDYNSWQKEGKARRLMG
jgi:hypothetical protein